MLLFLCPKAVSAHKILLNTFVFDVFNERKFCK